MKNKLILGFFLAFLLFFKMDGAEGTVPFGVGRPVLLFHRVAEKEQAGNIYLISEDSLRSIFKVIKNAGFETITIFDLLAYYRGEKPLSEKSFLLTFDDGTKSNIEFVDPLLKEFGFHAVLFVNILMQEKRKEGYLTWSEINELFQNGRWDIQAHGYRYHTTIPINERGDLGEFASNLMWLEEQNRLETIAEYEQRLRGDLAFLNQTLTEQIPGNKIIAFAFPFGEIGFSAINLNPTFASAINYSLVREFYELSFAGNVNDPAQFYLSPSPQLILRFEPPPDLPPSAFITVLGKSEPGIGSRSKEKIFTHDRIVAK
jgi:hypothetical protein